MGGSGGVLGWGKGVHIAPTTPCTPSNAPRTTNLGQLNDLKRPCCILFSMAALVVA